MIEFDELRNLYYLTDGSRPDDTAIKEMYVASDIRKEIEQILTFSVIYHLGPAKKTFLFKDNQSEGGQLVAISYTASGTNLSRYSAILLECAKEFYENQTFHKNITGLDGDKLLQYAIRKYNIPIQGYYNLSNAEIITLEDNSGKATLL